MSGVKILSASGTDSSVAVGFTRRTIAILLAAAVGLATFVFLMGGGGTVAHAAPTTINAKVGTSYSCDETEWHFVITQTSAQQAPATIMVTFSDGQATVPLNKVTGGTAHYYWYENLDSTVVSATAVIDSAWTGQFNLSHGPCNTSTPTPTPTSTPTSTPSEKPSETPSEKPSETPSKTPSETPSEKPSETPAPVPTAVPGGANPSGGSGAGLLGLALATSGVVAGTMVIARRRFLHDS